MPCISNIALAPRYIWCSYESNKIFQRFIVHNSCTSFESGPKSQKTEACQAPLYVYESFQSSLFRTCTHQHKNGGNYEIGAKFINGQASKQGSQAETAILSTIDFTLPLYITHTYILILFLFLSHFLFLNISYIIVNLLLAIFFSSSFNNNLLLNHSVFIIHHPWRKSN